MQYQGTLLSVANMEKAKHFYHDILGQSIMMDLGVHVALDRGLALQSNYEELVGETLPAKERPNNFQIYFEVDDIESWQKKLQEVEGVEFIHTAKEYPWGQRVFRVYDFDKYIVEIAESMESVAKRFLATGLTPEQVSERIMYPVEFVKSVM